MNDAMPLFSELLRDLVAIKLRATSSMAKL